MVKRERRPTRTELVNALRFIAFVPQAYYQQGPDVQIKQAADVAWQILQRENQALMAREEGR